MKDQDTRPDVRTWLLGVAAAVAVRADCRRRQVGALVVAERRFIISTGYNGTPKPRMRGCLEGLCPRGLRSYSDVPAYSDYGNCISVHAEINAVRNCPVPVVGKVVVVTEAPCAECLVSMAFFGIAEVWWPDGTWVNPSSERDVRRGRIS